MGHKPPQYVHQRPHLPPQHEVPSVLPLRRPELSPLEQGFGELHVHLGHRRAIHTAVQVGVRVPQPPRHHRALPRLHPRRLYRPRLATPPPPALPPREHPLPRSQRRVRRPHVGGHPSIHHSESVQKLVLHPGAGLDRGALAGEEAEEQEQESFHKGGGAEDADSPAAGGLVGPDSRLTGGHRHLLPPGLRGVVQAARQGGCACPGPGQSEEK
mmetsp:Transcript_71062/g.162957  ORF Transcript_71062/g.162957 Transcript_71062/m.162957 type:complete len:213 (-) Transcript_71062:842-1480(-)